MSGILCASCMGLGVTATTNGALFYGSRVGGGSATTATCTVTPVNGVAPYTYAWTKTSGDATTAISSATSGVVTWNRLCPTVALVDSFWSCVVTDLAGGTFTIIGIDAQLERTS